MMSVQELLGLRGRREVLVTSASGGDCWFFRNGGDNRFKQGGLDEYQTEIWISHNERIMGGERLIQGGLATGGESAITESWTEANSAGLPREKSIDGLEIIATQGSGWT